MVQLWTGNTPDGLGTAGLLRLLINRVFNLNGLSCRLRTSHIFAMDRLFFTIRALDTNLSGRERAR